MPLKNRFLCILEIYKVAYFINKKYPELFQLTLKLIFSVLMTSESKKAKNGL